MLISTDIAMTGGLYIFNNSGGGGGGPSGFDNVVGYTEMDPPVLPGTQLQNSTATINGSVGFTINNDTETGVAIPALSVSNGVWFTANYTTVPESYTCTWGPDSTVASSTITVVSLTPNSMVFYIQGQSGPATYNYPFTFSI